MPQLDPAQLCNDMTSKYDARVRTFDKLRNLKLTGEERLIAINEYANANREFEEAKALLLKSEKR